MKKGSIEALAFSIAGIFLVAILVIAINFLFSGVQVRADLTSEKVHTLSDGTRKVLSRLDTPVEIRFYFTKDDTDMPPYLKVYANRVDDLLSEYQKANPKFVKVVRLNPAPDSDAEDSARLDGIRGQPLMTGDNIYLGVAVVCLDRKETIPMLTPERGSILEYDITRAISNAMRTEKPVIGVMSALPVLGSDGNPMMMGQQRPPTEPWLAFTELKKDYDVREVMMDGEKIDESIKVLAVFHPAGISPDAQYAIDQFLMRGGKLIVFVDPLSLVQSATTPQNQMMMMRRDFSSNLANLFPAWGINYDPTTIVADMTFANRFSRPGGTQVVPVGLSLDDRAFNKGDAAVADVTKLEMLAVGALVGNAPAGLANTVLVHSSTDSQLVPAQSAMMGGFDKIIKDFKAENKELPLTVRIAGKFKSAFPEGKPKPPQDPENPEQPKPDEPKEDSLKESSHESSIIVVADTDFAYDEFAFQMIGPGIAMPKNSNLAFFQNLIDVTAGDSELMSIRGRASVNRPFTVVSDMEKKAEERFRAKINELEEGLQQTEQRINELQAGKEGDQQFILSPEQQKEIEKFRKQEAESKKELKKVRRELRADIESLETKTMWINILAVPALVTAVGIILAIVRYRRRSAQ